MADNTASKQPGVIDFNSERRLNNMDRIFKFSVMCLLFGILGMLVAIYLKSQAPRQHGVICAKFAEWKDATLSCEFRMWMFLERWMCRARWMLAARLKLRS